MSIRTPFLLLFCATFFISCILVTTRSIEDLFEREENEDIQDYKDNIDENIREPLFISKVERKCSSKNCLQALSSRDVKMLKVRYCDVYPFTIPVKNPCRDDDWQNFIQLQRCAGSVLSDHTICAPQENTILDVQVNFKVNDHEVPRTITLKNHTRCVEKCVRSCKKQNKRLNKEKCICIA